MNKSQPEIAQAKLAINVEFDDPLKTMLLRQCEAEDRTMAGMVRVICKRYFAEQMFAVDSRPRSNQDKLADLPYFPDELPGSRRGEVS